MLWSIWPPPHWAEADIGAAAKNTVITKRPVSHPYLFMIDLHIDLLQFQDLTRPGSLSEPGRR
jgi:hypothetical protein